MPMTKRTFDILVAAAGLILLSPLFLIVAVLINLDSSGAIFFRQERLGMSFKPFHILKFRTMVHDADERGGLITAGNDPRITRVGRVLRETKIDELPQLINILKGEMSFVGPRPVVQDELEMYGAAVDCYLRARPGLTGLWQISGRNDVSYEQRVNFDRYYVENWSFGFDLLIIVKTLPAVILSRGSY